MLVCSVAVASVDDEGYDVRRARWTNTQAITALVLHAYVYNEVHFQNSHQAYHSVPTTTSPNRRFSEESAASRGTR
jgi:hypothetical protein